MALDLPPQLILPDYWEAKRPAIIRPGGDILRSERERLRLAGVMPGIGAFLGGAEGFSLEFVTSTTSTGTSITIPAAAEVGDIAILLDSEGEYGNSNNTISAPSGWDEVSKVRADSSGGSQDTNISRKVLASGEPGSSVSPGGSSGDVRGAIMLIFRANKAIASVTAVVYDPTVSNTTPASITVNPSAETNPVIVFGAASRGGGGSTPSVAYTHGFDGVVTLTTGQRMAMGYKIANDSPPASGSISGSDAGSSNSLQAFYLRVVAAA